MPTEPGKLNAPKKSPNSYSRHMLVGMLCMLVFTGVVFTVDHYDDALRALHRAGFTAVSEDALLIRLPDEPGALAGVMKRFKEAALNIRSVRFISRRDGFAVVAIGVERTDEALALVKDLLLA